MLERRYKFYLSFENSYCTDYTTEKLFNVLKRNIVPIVYGGGNYSSVAPPHSVINVEDFENVESLANYLEYLGSNVTEYLRYFEWKKHYYISKSRNPTVCKLCQMLNDPNEPSKSYEDINEWWFSNNNSGCKTVRELVKILH